MTRDDPNEGKFELVSGYRGGGRYLNLRFDPGGRFVGNRPNYFYTGTGCGGGFGYDVDKTEALRRFGGMVAADRVKLEHYAGEKVDSPLDSFTKGESMTTAEFKRRMVLGSRWRRTYHPTGVVADRLVIHVQSKDFCTVDVDWSAEDQAKRSNWSWMDFVKSDKLRLLADGTILILDPHIGKPLLSYTPLG